MRLGILFRRSSSLHDEDVRGFGLDPASKDGAAVAKLCKLRSRVQRRYSSKGPSGDVTAIESEPSWLGSALVLRRNRGVVSLWQEREETELSTPPVFSVATENHWATIPPWPRRAVQFDGGIRPRSVFLRDSKREGRVITHDGTLRATLSPLGWASRVSGASYLIHISAPTGEAVSVERQLESTQDKGPLRLKVSSTGGWVVELFAEIDTGYSWWETAKFGRVLSRGPLSDLKLMDAAVVVLAASFIAWEIQRRPRTY